MLRGTLFLSLLFLIALTACSPGTATSVTMTPSRPPTQTLIPEATSTIAPSPSETPSPTATPWAFESQVSPNGEFVANAYFEFELPSDLPAIEIRDRDGGLIWQIPFQGEMPTGDPHRTLSIFQWAKDSSQLYFFYEFIPDGGDRAFWWTGLDLQRIDMQTEEIQALLPGEGFMSFAISPDGTQIAYTRQQDQPSVFYIRDLVTGSEKKAAVIFGSKNYVRVGDIRWSPSGKRIAFQTETEDDYMVQTILLDPVTMKQKVIREYQLFTLSFDGWADDGKLQFAQFSSSGMSIEQVIQIDVTTSEILVIGTSTPQP